MAQIDSPANVGSNDGLGHTLPDPWDYCYEWDGPYGTRKFSQARHNGSLPSRSVPVFTAGQMAAHAAAAVAAAIARAPIAVMDTRTALGVCALTEDAFPALYALRGRRVALVDMGPNV